MKGFGLFLFILGGLVACMSSTEMPSDEGPQPNIEEKENVEVLSVSVSGDVGAYTFSVELKSPDTGCDQYADWWEVIDADNTLIYRRILAHSHVSEQPFTRSGGVVAIAQDQEVIVRGHMNNLGYGKVAMKGSVSAGFTTLDLEDDFASHLATVEPLPDDCAF